MLKKFEKNKIIYLFIVIINLFCGQKMLSATRYAVASGNWSSTSTWSASSNGSSGASVPIAGDDVYVERGYNVTVDADNACSSLTIGTNTSGANSSLIFNSNKVLTVSGSVVVGFNSSYKGTLDMTSGGVLKVGGNVTMTASSYTFNSGYGTIIFNGSSAQTGTSLPFYNLTIANTSGGVTLSNTATVSGYLRLTSGILTTTGLTVTNTSPNAIIGGSTTCFVSGPLSWTLPANLNSSSSIYTFPIGKNSILYPFYLSSPTTGATGPTITVEAFNANAGGSADGTTIPASGISTTEYWSASYTGNYNNGVVSIGRQTTLDTLNAIGRCATKTGSYSSIQGSASGTTIIYSSLTGSNLGYFLMASRFTFYSKSSANLNLNILSNWGIIRSSGSGAAPSSFLLTNTIWNIRNTVSPTLSADWDLSGVGSYIIVGDGTNSCNFTIPSGQTSILPTINVLNNATLTIQSTAIPTLGTLSNGSTVNYSSGSSQNVSAANYYNLDISGGNRVLASTGNIGIANTFTPGGGTLTLTGSTIVFNGTGAQTIPAMTYNNIQTQIGGTKTLSNSAGTSINGILTVGNISTFDAGTGTTITFNNIGSGGRKRIVSTGTFTPSTSTVVYAGTNDTVAAVNYNNLNLTGGSGKFENVDFVGIKGTFNAGSGAGSWSTTGSTVKFNGTTAQTGIPAFTFNNLIFDNTAGMSLGGAVVVNGTLTMTNGILLTTSTNLLSVTNTLATSVGGGKTTAFVNGPLKRSFPNLTASSSVYSFPVGNGTTYYPFSLSNLTTSSSLNLTVEAKLAATNSFSAPLTAVNTENYWQVTNNAGTLTSGTVSLTRQNPIGSNSIGFNASGNSNYANYGGTVSGSNSIINSNPIPSITTTVSGYFASATRTITTTTYYSQSSAGLDLSNPANWGTSTDGSTGGPADFTKSDATFIIQNTTTPTVGSNWNLTGSNISVQLGDGTNAVTFTVPTGKSVSFNGNLTINKNATLTTQTGGSGAGTVTVLGNLVIPTSGASTPITVNNSGNLTVFGTIDQVANSYSTINNLSSGILNLNGNYSNGAYTNLNNYGIFNITNGSVAINQNQNSWAFSNKAGGVINLDNSGVIGKNVTLTNLNFANDFVLQSGSKFNITKADFNFVNGYNTLPIAGVVIITDANFNFPAGNLNITTPGAVYMLDTDNSGDGLFVFGASGGVLLTDNGILYAEGVMPMSAGGGGNQITVANGASMFIGNIGLYTGLNNNYLTVNNGGTLNFCGNKTAGADGVGKIDAGGTLNYALGYYSLQSPGPTATGGQGDFDPGTGGMGAQVAAYADAASCLAAYENNITNILPISLDYFDVKLNGEKVAIEWRTASETNNDFFTVMKSYDASTFEIIGTINGAGTSTINHYYTFNDEEPQNGINYYKIKQTDFDGTATFSQMRSIKYKKKNVFLQVYPIPGTNVEITLKLWSLKSETITLMISDIMGKVYASGQIEVSNNRLEIPISTIMKLVPGKYIVTVYSKLYVDNTEIIVE